MFETVPKTVVVTSIVPFVFATPGTAIDSSLTVGVVGKVVSEKYSPVNKPENNRVGKFVFRIAY